MKYFFGAISLLAFMPTIAAADNIADCEIVLMETIEDESGRGSAKIASYRPAVDFMSSIYSDDEDSETLYKIDNMPIQAVMCKRSDIIPTKNDFKVVATGIPFFLSQSFESQDTDLITVFFKDGEFRHVYKGPGLSEETEGLLEKRLAAFTKMDHGLAEKEIEKAAAKATALDIKEKSESKDNMSSTEDDVDVDTNLAEPIETQTKEVTESVENLDTTPEVDTGPKENKIEDSIKSVKDTDSEHYDKIDFDDTALNSSESPINDEKPSTEETEPALEEAAETE